MMIIKYSDGELLFPEAAGYSLDFLFDVHFMFLVRKRNYKDYFKIKEEYKEKIPLFLNIVKAEIIRNINHRIFPKSKIYSIYESKFVKIKYYFENILKIDEQNVMYTPEGYIEFIGLSSNNTEIYRAYLFNEGLLLKLLYTWYTLPQRIKREQKGSQKHESSQK